MERLEFADKYSFKNITTPARLEFTKQFVHSIEKLLRRMRYRASFYLQLGEQNISENDEECSDDRFALLFKSGSKPPFIKDMVNFEKELLDLPKILQFRSYVNLFQREMKENLNDMNSKYNDKVLVPGDKTNNYFPVVTYLHTKSYSQNV